MGTKLLEEIGLKLNMSRNDVEKVVTEFIIRLHKDFYEREKDIFGTYLYFNLNREAY